MHPAWSACLAVAATVYLAGEQGDQVGQHHAHRDLADARTAACMSLEFFERRAQCSGNPDQWRYRVAAEFGEHGLAAHRRLADSDARHGVKTDMWFPKR